MLTMISWQNMLSDAYSCYEKTNMKDDFEITQTMDKGAGIMLYSIS